MAAPGCETGCSLAPVVVVACVVDLLALEHPGKVMDQRGRQWRGEVVDLVY